MTGRASTAVALCLECCCSPRHIFVNLRQTGERRSDHLIVPRLSALADQGSAWRGDDSRQTRMHRRFHPLCLRSWNSGTLRRTGLAHLGKRAPTPTLGSFADADTSGLDTAFVSTDNNCASEPPGPRGETIASLLVLAIATANAGLARRCRACNSVYHDRIRLVSRFKSLSPRMPRQGSQAMQQHVMKTGNPVVRSTCRRDACPGLPSFA